MTKVAVLYICTGKYIAFWQEFYESAEQYLLPGCEVHYFVFTDAPSLYGEEDNPRIHRCPQKAYSWPFSTLLRFEIFLSREEELKAFDYIFFFNANAQFTTTITPEMFLPRADRGEHLLVVQHPAFYNKPNYEYTYDRNPRCRAFIPMGLGKYYVCGGINGGETAAFLKLCHTLDRRITKIWRITSLRCGTMNPRSTATFCGARISESFPPVTAGRKAGICRSPAAFCSAASSGTLMYNSCARTPRPLYCRRMLCGVMRL